MTACTHVVVEFKLLGVVLFVSGSDSSVIEKLEATQVSAYDSLRSLWWIVHVCGHQLQWYVAGGVASAAAAYRSPGQWLRANTRFRGTATLRAPTAAQLNSTQSKLMQSYPAEPPSYDARSRRSLKSFESLKVSQTLWPLSSFQIQHD